MSDTSLGRATDAPQSWILRIPGLRRYAARLAHTARQLERVHQQLQVLGARLKSDRSRFARINIRNKRRHLSPDVPYQTMALRHHALLARGSQPEAVARHTILAERSEAYRSLALNSERLAEVAGDSVAIGGLTWWVPPDARETGNLADRMLRLQWLPMRDILETRELALGTVMIDIGANIGTTSIPRVVLGDFEYVYAAEPAADNYACLVRNVIHNGLAGRVLPDRLAIGASDGEALLQCADQIGTHHLVSCVTDQVRTIAVPCLTLDTWIRQLDLDLNLVTFIKVDTQGWEPRVLEGASCVLSHRHIAWQIELSPALLKRADSSQEELYALVQRHFTHFIDLRALAGPRVRRTGDLADALLYITKRERRQTNLLLYNGG